VFTAFSQHDRTHWWSRPGAAAAASLLVVTFFIGLLGIVFLPREAQLLAGAPYVSITHWLMPSADRPAIALFWSMPPRGREGWQRHVALQSSDAARPDLQFLCPTLRPLSLAAGADADHVLVGGWDGNIYSCDLNQPHALPRHLVRQPDSGVVALACSPDGRYLLSQSAFHAYGWDLATGRQLWRRSDVASYCFAIRPDSARAILGTLDGELIEIDFAKGQPLRTLARCDGHMLVATLSPGGEQLAIMLANGDLQLFDSFTGALRWKQQTERDCPTAAGRFTAFSPGGQLLVTAGRRRSDVLTVWNLATGEVERELRGHQRMVLGAAFAADGSLHSWGADGTVRRWDLGTGAATRVAALAPPIGPG
jgi:WD40 repeat protein